jgi:hypothetical protein
MKETVIKSINDQCNNPQVCHCDGHMVTFQLFLWRKTSGSGEFPAYITDSDKRSLPKDSAVRSFKYL